MCPRHVRAFIIGLLLPAAIQAQSLPVLPPSEFHRVEVVTAPTLSARASWIAYSVRRPIAVGDSVQTLHLHRPQPDTTIRLERAQRPRFSADERWVVWSVAATDAARAKALAAKQTARNAAVFMNLVTLTRDSIDGVADYGFDASSRFLLLERYPARDTADHRIVMVIDLETGRRTTIGHVAEWRWSDRGSLLALTLGVRDGAPGGLQLFNARSSTLSALGTSGHAYRQTRWRSRSFDLVSLRARTLTAAAGAPHRVEVWRALDRSTSQFKLLPDTVPGIADSLMVVAHDASTWSETGDRLRVSVQTRPSEPDSVAGARRDTLPGVQIWHHADVRIFPAQQLQAAAAARRGIPLIWDVRSERALLVDAGMEETTQFTRDLEYAFVTSDSAYPWGAMFGRRYHDGFVVDLVSGIRRQVLDSVRYSWLSPGGRYILSFDGRDYHTTDVRTARRVNITATLDASFADVDYDTPTDLLPPIGRGGWLDGDAGVLLYDEYDVWLVRPDGSDGRRLTRGREDSVIHRMVMLDTARASVDPRRPVLYSLRGQWTEQRGYARAPRIDGPVERLLLRDRNYAFLTRADSADVLVWREESRQQSPTLFVSDDRLQSPRQLSRSNRFLEQYAASRTELVRYRNERGRDLKGVLLYPVNHDPEKVYPMIVYAYELLSSQMHVYQPPSERSPYNYSRWTQEGYFVLLPDIHFRHGDPGVSLLETLRPAVRSIVSRGLVDAKRIGFVGHSWGGYHGAYVATHSDLFAASVAGAPLTDFVSFMGQIHWSSGAAEVDHWETGQARMGVPYWEDRAAHRRNSPLERVDSMTTPLLLAHGNKDRVVEYFQSTILYNFARRAGKPVILLTYEDEDHSLQQTANQVDYHRRVLEWFGHYLKGDPAPEWIAKGIPFQELEAEKRRVMDRPRL